MNTVCISTKNATLHYQFRKTTVGYVFACNRQIKGSVADVDGQLVPGDQILVVNGVDIRSSQQQDTAAMLKVL